MFNLLKSSFSKVKKALAKTRSLLGSKIQALFKNPLSADTIDELEQILYEADLGSMCVEELINHVEKVFKKNKNISSDEIIQEMKSACLEMLTLPTIEEKIGNPHIILMVGVNGSGKTTSSAKLAKKFKEEGKSVLLAAGDTFRAAAVEQLDIWAKNIGVDIVKGRSGGDPSAVIYDAISSAISKKVDVVIADTAGRLQSKTELMQELEKILRVTKKLIPDAPHSIYLTLDATTGQNAVDQAKVFNDFTPLTGILLTKLDGSAKGGIVLTIQKELKIPVKYIGVGEGASDLMPFDKTNYVEALF